jgi:phosphate/sulfate permease
MTGTFRLRTSIKHREKARPQRIKSCGFAFLNSMKKGEKSMKSKRIAMFLCMVLMLCLMFSTTAYAAGSGDVAGAIEGTWSTASQQIKTVVNKVVFPVIDLILAVLFFAKLGTCYFEYRKHGQME